jgi:UDP-glucose 4-epimerase
VIVIDDLSTGREHNLEGAVSKGARLVPTDVTDVGAIERAIGGFRPDCVFHLAAQVDVRISVGNPGLDARVNVEGTVNLLEAARLGGCDRFVFASSCAAYGDPDPAALPLAEDSPLRPGSPYGQAKLAAEGYVAMYRGLHGMRTANMRFANVYGPRQGAVGEAGVVSIFCRRLIAGETPAVFGTGQQTRDFVYVGDVVRALIAAADRSAVGEFNVGTSIETTVLELVDALAEAAGLGELLPEMKPPRAGEIDRMSLDSSRAAELLGWRPAVDLREGLRGTWAWACEEHREGDPEAGVSPRADPGARPGRAQPSL